MNIITTRNSCDIFKHYSVAEMKSTSKVTGKTYFIKGDLSCNSKNFIFSITCDKWKDEYVRFAISFRIPKSDVKRKTVRCGISRHFIESVCFALLLLGYLEVQIVEQVYSKDPSKIEEVLWLKTDTGKVNFHIFPWNEQYQ